MKEKAKRIERKIFEPQAENVHSCGSFNHWSESADPMKKDSTAKFAPNITGDVGSMTAYALARLCYDTLLEYGLAAKISCEAHAVTPALEHVVEAG